MARRKSSRFEILAVLRGELQYWRNRGGEREAAALQRAIEVMGGERQPSGPAPGIELSPLEPKAAVSSFIGGLLDGKG